jgi:hypothetical protein
MSGTVYGVCVWPGGKSLHDGRATNLHACTSTTQGPSQDYYYTVCTACCFNYHLGQHLTKYIHSQQLLNQAQNIYTQ